MNGSINELKKTERLWQRIALIAGAFAVILCVMIIVNYFQVNRDDPVSTEVMDQLVERLRQNPSDDALREQVRALDLVARKAYFTNQWQLRTGGYLLLISVAVVIISMQVILFNRKKEPLVTEEINEDFLLRQQKARRWISAGGLSLVVAALVLAFFSHQDLREKFVAATITPADEDASSQSARQEAEPVAEPVMDPVPERGPETDTASGNEKTAQETTAVDTATATATSTAPAAAATTTPATTPATIFPSFRGPGGNGICPQKNIPVQWDGATGENIRWKTKIPLSGFNSPIILGDMLFLTGAEDNRREVYGIDRHTGEIIWTKQVVEVPGSPAKPPEVANYTGHAAPTMATDGRHVFAIFANGDMIALDTDGNTVWSKNLGVPVNHYGYSSSLLTHGDKVFIQYDQKNLARVLALDGATGEEVWSVKRDVKISWASPVLVNTGSRMELLTVADPVIVSYNPDTGEEWWRIKGVIGEVGPSPAYGAGLVFAVNDYSRLVAVKVGDPPQVAWEDEDYLSDIPSPVVSNGLLFMATSYGMFVCYDAQTGEKYWEQEAESSIYASPVVAEGRVYMIDKEGNTYIYEVASEYKLIGTPALGEKVVCTPAFADGTVYIRGYEHVYSIGK